MEQVSWQLLLQLLLLFLLLLLLLSSSAAAVSAAAATATAAAAYCKHRERPSPGAPWLCEDHVCCADHKHGCNEDCTNEHTQCQGSCEAL
jgi:hypothetical protein